MSFPWSFLRLLLLAGAVLVGSGILEQATGDDMQGVTRPVGVPGDVNDWDIRSLYRVRFQHVTKRPHGAGGPRNIDRKSLLATRWAALKERIADLFPSRHTNPRTVVTFDKLATDFVNVGIVKLAKVLDPPKSTPRRVRKGKGTTALPPGTDGDADTVNLPVTTKATPPETRPKRRVTLLVDIPDFDADDYDALRRGTFLEEPEDEAEKAKEEDEQVTTTTHSPKRESSPLEDSGLPMMLVDDRPCAAGSTATATSPIQRLLMAASSVAVSLLTNRLVPGVSLRT